MESGTTLKLDNQYKLIEGTYTFSGISQDTSTFGLINDASSKEGLLSDQIYDTSLEMINIGIVQQVWRDWSNPFYLIDISGESTSTYLNLTNVYIRNLYIFINEAVYHNSMIYFGGYDLDSSSESNGDVYLNNVAIDNVHAYWWWVQLLTFYNVYSCHIHGLYISNVVYFGWILEINRPWYVEELEIIDLEMSNIQAFASIMYLYHMDRIKLENLYFNNVNTTHYNDWSAWSYLKGGKYLFNATNLTIANSYTNGTYLICWDWFFVDIYFKNFTFDNVGTNGAAVVYLAWVREAHVLHIDGFRFINNNNVDYENNEDKSHAATFGTNKFGYVLDLDERMTGGCDFSNFFFDSNVFTTRIFYFDGCWNFTSLDNFIFTNNEIYISNEFDYVSALIVGLSNEPNVTLTNLDFSNVVINVTSTEYEGDSYNLIHLSQGSNFWLSDITMESISQTAYESAAVVKNGILALCVSGGSTFLHLENIMFSKMYTRDGFVSVWNCDVEQGTNISNVSIESSESDTNGIALLYMKSLRLNDVGVEDASFGNSVLYFENCTDCIVSGVRIIGGDGAVATHLIEVVYDDVYGNSYPMRFIDGRFNDYKLIDTAISVFNSIATRRRSSRRRRSRSLLQVDGYLNFLFDNVTFENLNYDGSGDNVGLININEQKISIKFENCRFTTNNNWKGIVVCHDETRCRIEFVDCVFDSNINTIISSTNNNASNTTTTTVNVIALEDNSQGAISIINSTFIGNDNETSVTQYNGNDPNITFIDCDFVIPTASPTSMPVEATIPATTMLTTSTDTETDAPEYNASEMETTEMFTVNDSSGSNFDTTEGELNEDTKADSDFFGSLSKWLNSMGTGMWVVVIIAAIMFTTCLGVMFVFAIVKCKHKKGEEEKHGDDRKGRLDHVKSSSDLRSNYNDNTNGYNDNINSSEMNMATHRGTESQTKDGGIVITGMGDHDKAKAKGVSPPPQRINGKRSPPPPRPSHGNSNKRKGIGMGGGYNYNNVNSGSASPVMTRGMINDVVNKAQARKARQGKNEKQQEKEKEKQVKNTNGDGGNKGESDVFGYNNYKRNGYNYDDEKGLALEGAGAEMNARDAFRQENRMYRNEVEERFNMELNKALHTKQKENFGEKLQDKGYGFENAVMDDILDHMNTNK